MKVSYLDLKREHLEQRDRLMSAVANVLDRCQFILGEEVAKFEKRISEKLNLPFVLGVNSGTDALLLPLLALGIKEGDEVITVSNSFFATANAIKLAGAKPIFVDIADDLLMDVNLIEKAITPRTRAIMPVHLTGKPVQMDEIQSLAKKYNLTILEDCAQAVGAKYKNKAVGSFGIGAFSLHPLKNLNACGDGGFISTTDSNLYEKLKKLRNHGLRDRDHLEMVGYNSRLDEIQAALLNVKLDQMETVISARRKNAVYYTRELEACLGRGLLSLPSETKNEFSVYHTFVIRTERRDALQKFLESKGIETKIHYPYPIHTQTPYRDTTFALPKTERIAAEILSLPIHQSLTESELEYVVTQMKEFHSK